MRRHTWHQGLPVVAAMIMVVTATLVAYMPTFAAPSNPPSFTLPFPSGQEWQITNGWTGHAKGQNPQWNRWAMDFAPINGGCENIPVLAAADGVVEKLDQSQGQVIIRHTGDWRSNYLHLNSFSVSLQQQVRQGQQIGTCGHVGNANGAHIHFQVINGDPGHPNTGYKTAIQGYDNLETGTRGLYSTAPSLAPVVVMPSVAALSFVWSSKNQGSINMNVCAKADFRRIDWGQSSAPAWAMGKELGGSPGQCSSYLMFTNVGPTDRLWITFKASMQAGYPLDSRTSIQSVQMNWTPQGGLKCSSYSGMPSLRRVSECSYAP